MSSGKIIIRRAKLSDYEAVLDINDNIYGGLDYMPTMFYEFLQSKKHAVYVAENVKDHKLVALVNFLIDGDGKTYYPLSGRVRMELERGGLMMKIFTQAALDHPAVERAVFDALRVARSEKTIGQSRLLYRWNCMVYRIASSSLKSWVPSSTSVKSDHPASLTPVQLTHSATEQLLADGRLETFLRRFSDYIPASHPTWVARPVSRCGLADQLRWSDMTLVSYDISGCGAKTAVCSASFHNSFALKTKTANGDVYTDVVYYGDSMGDFCSHLSSHLRQLTNVISSGDMHLYLSFPLSLEMSAVENELRGSHWPDSRLLMKTEAYLAANEFPSKL